MIVLDCLDHLVLTVWDVDSTCDFYTTILGMERIHYGEGRIALCYGDQKINLHMAGNEFEPKAHAPTPGSADLCFMTRTSMEEMIDHLAAHGIPVEEGPIRRSGATSRLNSIYVRDPDGNLIELSNALSGGTD